jgi:hypothetical protein
MKLIHEILTASSISALEIKYVTKVKIRRIDYPGYLFCPEEMFERGLRSVHANVSVAAEDRLGWKKTFVFMMQLTSDDESSEIIEIFPEEPCVSLSAEFVALGLNRSQIFLGFRDHVAMVIRAEMKFPGKYSKNKARIPRYKHSKAVLSPS